MTRRIISVLATAIMTAALVGVATPAQAYTNTCWTIDKSWPIQDGTVDINTGWIDAFGKLCVRNGYLYRPGSYLTLNVRTSSSGDWWGFSYRKVGQEQIYNAGVKEEWRLYGAYKWCVAKYGFLCSSSFNGHEGRFTIDVSFYQWGGRYTRPDLIRDAFFRNTNEWSDVRWS